MFDVVTICSGNELLNQGTKCILYKIKAGNQISEDHIENTLKIHKQMYM
jgi:hypothetical protein